MSNYSVGSGGDYAVHRAGAVTLVGTENVTVDHNLFDAMGGNCVWLHAYNRKALVAGNEMRNIGENGVGPSSPFRVSASASCTLDATG